jgi:hypothetical protein
VSARRRYSIALVLLCSCSRAGDKVAPQTREVPTSQASKPSALTAEPAPGAAENAKEVAKTDDEDLKTEEREANPFSETVTLHLSLSPPVKAVAMWGQKQVAKFSPGNMDAELTRPRGGGPLDLEIRADGYLPHHTRLYADRNDKVSVRLYRVEEAPGLLGYKRSSSATEKKKP